jgi:hypothetical protein
MSQEWRKIVVLTNKSNGDRIRKKRERDERYEAKPTGSDQLVVAAWKSPLLWNLSSGTGEGAFWSVGF